MRALMSGALALGVAMTVCAQNSSAQTSVRFGLGGGATVPSGSTNDGLKTGWHGTALVQVLPASSPVGFQVDGSYHQLNFDDNDGKDEIIDGTANLIYEFKTSETSKVRPYLIGGGGVYHVKGKPDVGESASDTKFGVNAGAGFNFGSSNTSFFVEGRFHNIFLSDVSDFHFIPITVGVRFGGS